MNRCPNHHCRQTCEAGQGFCYHCGIAIKLCNYCQQNRKITLNRADGFYCRRCGSVLAIAKRNQETTGIFNNNRKSLLSSLKLALNERSDSFLLISSQAKLWVLTSNNSLRIISNKAKQLTLEQVNTGRLNVDELQSAIKYLEPVTSPVIFRDRLILFGEKKFLSFSIHPNENRWLQNRTEVILPENWQTVFSSDITCKINYIELAVKLIESGQYALARLSYDVILNKTPITLEMLSNTTEFLPISALDLNGHYYWAKDLQTGLGRILYLTRQENSLLLKPINYSSFYFFVRPVMINERLYGVTEDFRLVELNLQQGEVNRQRKISQINRGAHRLVVTQDKIIVAVHQSLLFFDFQTGEMLNVGHDIDPTHLFVDPEGNLLAIHRTGRLLMINSEQPLERWGTEDASMDDSRIFDAFVLGNSLYTLSENGEVCRFDFN